MFEWLGRLFGREEVSPNHSGITAPAVPFLQPSPTIPPWLALPDTVLFVDVETTGFKPGVDRIVSFAGILMSSASLKEATLDLEYGHYIVDPGRLCHPRAAAVHGYSDWLLRHQQPFSEVVDSVIELLEKAELIVTHNAAFDVGFINAELAALGYAPVAKPTYCTAEACRARLGAGSASLDAAAGQIGFSRAGQRHGALEDAWLAMMVFFWLHDYPGRFQFGAFSNPHPKNLRPAPPMPDDAATSGKAVLALRDIIARSDAARPPLNPAFTPRRIDPMVDDDSDDAADGPAGRADYDLHGVSFGIEYTDAYGRESTRRVTVSDLRHSGEHLYLRCFCHECGASRTFRFDRIRSIIDLDGMVHEPARFFEAELHAPLPSVEFLPGPAVRQPPRLSADGPGMAQRRAARDGLRLLAALARSDGLMQPAEVEVIIDYIASRAARDGIVTDDEDRRALASYVKRQRPTMETVDECLVRLGRGSATERRHFLKSAVDLVEADAQRGAAELAMLKQLALTLAGADGSGSF